jgi:hypothetical protein
MVIGAAAIAAFGTAADAASINVNWTAPTTNADGSALNDLAGYRLYMGTSTPSCPSGSYHSVNAPASSTSITGLNASTTYFVRITAVDSSGNESGCSAAASGVARGDVTVTPTSTVSFGNLTTGATADRTFTVQNTSGSTVSGSASVSAPFSIVSGGSFSLAAGASHAVVVRFGPTAAGSFTTNANFTVAGDTTQRVLNGSATAAGSPAPSQPAAPSQPPAPSQPSPAPPSSNGPLRVFITQPKNGATVAGSGTAVIWVEGTSGSSNSFFLSVNGVNEGSQTTPSRGPVTIPWSGIANGRGTFTATVRDATGKVGSATNTVTVTGSGASAPPPAPAPSQPSSPPSSPSNSAVKVFITQPKAGASLRGTAWVVLWAEGTSGSSNTFTLSVNGSTVGSKTTSARGPVSIPWTTSGIGNRTITATVRDASGHTGQATVTVTLAN